MAASRYYVDGKRVPGVTYGITGQLGWSKEALMHWANKQGLAGTELRDAQKAAKTGSIAHAMVEADIAGEEADLDGIDPEMRKTVERILTHWKTWKEQHIQDVLLSEKELTSPTLLYGGRLDMVFVGKDQKVWLCDVKTGGIYPEALVQIAAYAMLVEENTDIKVDTLALLRIPQDSDTITTMERPWKRDSTEAETVTLCRRLHHIHAELKREV